MTSEWKKSQTLGEMQLIDAVNAWQDAVRLENSGFGAGSGVMARGTDAAWARVESLLRETHPKQLANMIWRLGQVLNAATTNAA